MIRCLLYTKVLDHINIIFLTQSKFLITYLKSLFFCSLSTKATVIRALWLCCISRTSSILRISIWITLQPVLDQDHINKRANSRNIVTNNIFKHIDAPLNKFFYHILISTSSIGSYNYIDSLLDNKYIAIGEPTHFNIQYCVLNMANELQNIH